MLVNSLILLRFLDRQQTQELKTLHYFRLKHVYVKGSQTHVLSQAGPSICNRRRKNIKQLNSEKHNV